MKIVFRTLPVRLSSLDVNSRAKKLAQVHAEYARKEEEKKEVTKTLGDALKELRAEADALSDVVNTGIENQAVECAWQPEGTQMVLRRLDTDEEIERRAQNADERQGTFELNLSPLPLP